MLARAQLTNELDALLNSQLGTTNGHHSLLEPWGENHLTSKFRKCHPCVLF